MTVFLAAVRLCWTTFNGHPEWVEQVATPYFASYRLGELLCQSAADDIVWFAIPSHTDRSQYMQYPFYPRFFRLLAMALVLFAFNATSALEKEDLVLVFQDDFESGLDGWTFRDPENWRVEKEGDSENHVLSLFAPGTTPRNYLGPQSVAIPTGVTAGDFILETRIRHRGKEYAHQDLCVLYNVSGDDTYYYTHIAPVSDEGANTIFIVDDADRKSIATERSDGTHWGEVWHDLRIVRDAGTGTTAVFFDDMKTPIMTANDRTFTAGSFGLGSFNDIGWFDDVRIWARPADAADGFVSLFDGASLAGWDASNRSYWSVEDAAITAESTEENPCTKNQFLVWQGGDVADFELKAKFRLQDNQGNSGIQFRSKIAADGTGVGYQADILPGGPWCGALADEYTGREPLMVPNGHKTIVAEDGTRTCTPAGEPVTLRPPGEWNDYHILAKGHRMVLTVNGQQSAEFIDNDVEKYQASGILALQLKAGPPMKVQFKDIYLKELR